MLIEEWNNDSFITCKLVMKENSQPFNFAVTAKINAMGQLDQDKNLIRFSIPKRTNPEREFQIFLTATESVESNDYWIMELNKESFVQPLIEVMNIPSVYFNSIQMDGNEIKLRFSFHESKLKNVSNFILKAASENPDISIVDIGRRDLLFNIVQEINDHNDIYVVGIISKPPETILSVGDASVRTKWIRLIKSVVSGKINGIIRILEGEINPNESNFIPIYEKEKLYQAETENKIIKEIEQESRKNGLDYLLRINSFDGEFWVAEYYILKEDAKAMLSIISDIIEKNQDWNLILRDFVPFSKMVA